MLTKYTKELFLKQLGGLVSGTSCYIALSTTAPNENASNYNVTEPHSTLGYSRQVFRTTSTSGSQGSGYIDANGALSNNDIIYFGEASGSWGTITHFCLFSAKTGGNLLAYGTLSSTISPTAGTVPLIRADEIKITLS